MSDYQLADDLYLYPTPAGVFHAVSSAEDEPTRSLLRHILSFQSCPKAEVNTLCEWLGVDDEQQALGFLHQAQTMSWIHGLKEAKEIHESGIGQEMATLIPHLSSVGKGLLVDDNGFSLARSGVDDSTAEALAVLSADLLSVQDRHATRMAQCLGVTTQAWGAVDAYGSSRIGVWPLYIGEYRFSLVLLGVPQLNRQEFIALVWSLVKRYGKDGASSEEGTE